jgi:hypothetical protein
MTTKRKKFNPRIYGELLLDVFRARFKPKPKTSARLPSSTV